jgi:hypothetical protein
MAGFQLSAHASLAKAEGPVLVCILDGYGENEYKDEFNAVMQASTPCFDKLRACSTRFRCEIAACLSALLVCASVMRHQRALSQALGPWQGLRHASLFYNQNITINSYLHVCKRVVIRAWPIRAWHPAQCCRLTKLRLR